MPTPRRVRRPAAAERRREHPGAAMEVNSPDSTKNGNSAGTTDCAQSASPSRTACAVSSERASTTAITASSAAAGAYRHLIRITSFHSMSAAPGLSPGQASFPAARHRLLRMGG